VPNDNRRAAGVLQNGILELDLVAGPAAWYPEEDGGPVVPVFAFSEAGGSPRIPGPLLRVTQGAQVRITVRNEIPAGQWIGLPPENRRNESTSSVTGATLFVHGLHAGTDDTIVVPYGETRQVQFRADSPGTFLYWAATHDLTLWAHTGADAQLAGAIVVDPADTVADPEERVFVITMIDAFPDPALADPGQDYVEFAINGLSWPHTERLNYGLGDAVRWRWVNASHWQHPMHLHGFHYRTLARGDGRRDTVFPPEKIQEVVTELMEPGSTIRMAWTATRPGNWLMHCHIVSHVVPEPARDAAERMHELHDVTQHPFDAMAGLVMGITISDEGPDETDGRPEQHLRLLAREKPAETANATIRGFVLAEEHDPPADLVSVPGPPIILTRGETTQITVVNQMREHTTVHWHGLELQSVYDGVAGWSRTGTRVAPLVAPGESFDVFIRPPRAGTFIYHSHMDELLQVTQGMYGPLLVLEPGEHFDAELDRIFVIADAIDGEHYNTMVNTTINGKRYPPKLTLIAGTKYRFRFINISEGTTVDINLTDGSETLTWYALAKDGAVLPPVLQREIAAEFRTQTGETYDFIWRPTEPMDATIVVDNNFGVFGTDRGRLVLNQQIRVVEP
jgi:FtsP/CotA-like multicopper oxidase with cupredoxin domain